MMSSTTYVPNDHRPLADDVNSMLSTAQREANAGAADLKQTMSKVYDGARDRLSRVDETLRTSARNAAVTTDDYVHGNPWRVISIGALVGLAVGLLIARR